MEGEGGKKILNVEDLNKSLRQFGMADYAVFCVMLVCCSLVGLYFGYEDHMKHKRKVKDKNRRASEVEAEAIEYLMGGRKMKVFPVAMSLVKRIIELLNCGIYWKIF
jgi:solute carrier family 5 (sodium-coupled monocarboxylate transporter), member 8/12